MRARPYLFAAIIVTVFAGTVWLVLYNESPARRTEFMAGCQQEHPKPECLRLWQERQAR